MSNETANYALFDMHLSAEVVLNTYIGGVNVFLGPALGAAVMTFFGYAVSDLTRSWLLYQGVLFVLVMMFMPSGMTGLLQWWSEQRGQAFRCKAVARGCLYAALRLFSSLPARSSRWNLRSGFSPRNTARFRQ